MLRHEVMDNLTQLLECLPTRLRLEEMDELDQLIEIVMDLGRQPEARFPHSFTLLGEEAITRDDLEYVVQRVGEFGADNRAGIERTLHRISAIRNRRGDVVGLTCRIGRAVFGTIEMLRDVVESGRSILLLGRPGVGKTTMLREVARVLADELQKRVIVVDTSNEIAGDGDIPHPGIGRARRMQVGRVERQAEVMIEAVENHMPEVIVIDEIGTEGEAQAARTIAERGVQLIGTAHGNTLDNLALNPTLSDLIGGIHAVTLGDEEARKRGTQKTVLERKAPPTFEVLVEIQSRDRLAVHHDVAATVDNWLRGNPPSPEVRERNQDGTILVQKSTRRRADLPGKDRLAAQGWNPQVAYDGGRRARGRAELHREGFPSWTPPAPDPARVSTNGTGDPLSKALVGPPVANRGRNAGQTILIYPYAVSKNRLEKAIAELRAPVALSNDLATTDLVLTLKGQYRKMPKKLKEAERRGIPVHIVRSNTIGQLIQFLQRYLSGDDPQQALLEAERAVAAVRARGNPVELSPQSAYVRRLQHEVIERYQLRSTSVGEEPDRRVLILPEEVH